MALLNLFKLEKLRVEAYADERRTPPAIDSMEVMFNPTTYKRTQSIAYAKARCQALNSPGRPARYSFTPPGDLSFQLVLDGTGVAEFGVMHIANLIGGGGVKKEIARFESLCVKMNGDIHEPNFLLVRWGEYTFSGRLKSLDITYKLFDESGDPIRAELDVAFVEDKSPERIAREAGLNSPDVTHVRIVRSGDTLPLLCKEIYGSSAYYLRVAADNRLDDFRNLVPGQRLYFAPLTPDRR